MDSWPLTKLPRVRRLDETWSGRLSSTAAKVGQEELLDKNGFRGVSCVSFVCVCVICVVFFFVCYLCVCYCVLLRMIETILFL